MSLTNHFIQRMFERFNIRIDERERKMFKGFYNLSLVKVYQDNRNDRVVYLGKIYGKEIVIISNPKQKTLITALTINDYENNISYSLSKIEDFRIKLNFLRKNFN